MRDLLALVLAPLYLDFVTDGEHLLITSVAHTQGIQTRAYDVGDIAKTPEVLALIAKSITTDVWHHNWNTHGGPGRIYLQPNADDGKRVLVITHHKEAHEEIGKALRRWRSSPASRPSSVSSIFVSGLR